MFRQQQSVEQKIAEQISQISENALDVLINSVQVSYNLIWNNQNATAENVLLAFGTEAKNVFATSRLTQKLIKTVKPDYAFLDSPFDVIFNEDGSFSELKPKGSEQQ